MADLTHLEQSYYAAKAAYLAAVHAQPQPPLLGLWNEWQAAHDALKAAGRTFPANAGAVPTPETAGIRAAWQEQVRIGGLKHLGGNAAVEAWGD